MSRRFRDALVIMNARTIPECMGAFDELEIPQIRIIGHTEAQIEATGWDEVLALAGDRYEWLWLVSDDAIVRRPALNAVRAAAWEGHPVVTGYSQRSHEDWTVNLTRGPLKMPHPTADAYDFCMFDEIVSHPEAVIRTWFTGMSLTGMSWEMWKLFPFQCFSANTGGYASDFALSWRLQEAQIPIVAAREGFCYHYRFDWITTNGIEDMKPVFDNPRIELRA